MTIVLQTPPPRRRSRRRARVIRARVVVFGIALMLSGYHLWSPSGARVEAAVTSAAAASAPELEPEQSIDTEGALDNGRYASDAALYVAER